MTAPSPSTAILRKSLHAVLTELLELDLKLAHGWTETSHPGLSGKLLVLSELAIALHDDIPLPVDLDRLGLRMMQARTEERLRRGARRQERVRLLMQRIAAEQALPPPGIETPEILLTPASATS